MGQCICTLAFLRNSSRSIEEDPTQLQDQDQACIAATCCGCCFMILLLHAALKVGYPVCLVLTSRVSLATYCQFFACIVPVDALSRTLPDEDERMLCLNYLFL